MGPGEKSGPVTPVVPAVMATVRSEDERAVADLRSVSSSAPSNRDAAFDEFCRREHASVTGLAYVLTGDWAIAQDLAQEAVFAAYRRWDHLQGYDNPGAWVRRVVANRAVSWRRRLASEATALVRLGNRRPPNAPSADELDGDVALWALVRRLPARQAQVFALTYVDDLSLDQVGEVLGISPGTAKTHLTRARAAMADARQELGDHADKGRDDDAAR